MASIRSLFFNRLMLNLALLLGRDAAADLALGERRLAAPAGAGLAGSCSAALLLLVVANGLAVPALRRVRRRAGWGGRLARLYMNAGVATLLVGVAVASSWLVFGLFAGLLGAVGAGAGFAFEAFRAASAAARRLGRGPARSGASASVRRASRARACASSCRASRPRSTGLRVVQISDLHIGNGLEGERLSRMVERSNALAPDLIVITGDIFDFDPAFIEDGLRRLAGLRARCGVYAILGNHDIYTGTQRVVDGLRRVRARDPAAARRDRAAAAAGAALSGRRRGSGAGLVGARARAARHRTTRRRARRRRPDPAARAPPRGVPAGGAARLSARARRSHPRRPARAADARAGPGTWRASSRASRAGATSSRTRRST